MSLVQLKTRTGAPIWINPDHIVCITQSNASNTYVGQPMVTYTSVNTIRMSIEVFGEPEDIIEQLDTGRTRQRTRAGVASGQ